MSTSASVLHDAAAPDLGEVVLEGRGLTKRFAKGGRAGILGRGGGHLAVDDVSLELRRGQVTALVGQSGSGKSTLGRMLAQLIPPTSGEILLHGRPVTVRSGRDMRSYTGEVQLTLQDPFASLNPLRRVSYILGRAVRLHQDVRGEREVRSRCAQLLERVGLGPTEHYLDRFPHELSGGERQRVSFARALAAGPSVLLADEPVSMLDVTIRKAMLDLIDDLRREENLAVLYITHDLGSARRYSSEVLVMHEGKVVERGESEQVIMSPRHEYTKRLLAAAPGSDAQLVWARVLASVAKADDAHADDIAAVLDGRRVIEGLDGGAELRWALLEALACTGHVDEARLDAELAADRTSLAPVRHLQAMSSRPDAQVKAEVFAAAIGAGDLSNDQVSALAAGFAQPGQGGLVESYVQPYFDALEQVWASRSQELAQRTVLGLFPRGGDLEAGVSPEQMPVPVAAQRWLDEHPGAPRALRRLVIEQRDHVLRALRCQGAALG